MIDVDGGGDCVGGCVVGWLLRGLDSERVCHMLCNNERGCML